MDTVVNIFAFYNFSSDLVKNKTLEFFSKTLPILQVDETLPKVTKYQAGVQNYYKNYENDVNTS